MGNVDRKRAGVTHPDKNRLRIETTAPHHTDLHLHQLSQFTRAHNQQQRHAALGALENGSPPPNEEKTNDLPRSSETGTQRRKPTHSRHHGLEVALVVGLSFPVLDGLLQRHVVFPGPAPPRTSRKEAKHTSGVGVSRQSLRFHGSW